MTPLHGLVVLDASRVLAGPLCGQTLADLGATVIKLERPGAGDDTRAWGPPFHEPGLSAYFLSINRGKRGIAIDLAQPAGLELFHRLLDKSDVLIENFRRDSAVKMGLAPDELLARHPRLVACSITGFGHTGPMRDDPGYDLAAQAMSGMMAMTGPPDGSPTKTAVALADVLTGLHAAIGILAGIRARETTGKGCHVDLSLLDCAVASQVNLGQAYLLTGQVPPRAGNAHFQIVPYGVFQASDGWIVLNVGNDMQWRQFCVAAEAASLADDDCFTTNPLRVRHRDVLTPILDELLRARSVKEWCDRLAAAKVPHSPVNEYPQVFAHPQVQARGMTTKVDDVSLIGTPFHLTGAETATPTFPPRIGEHTDEVLRSMLGIDDAELRRLRDEEVIG